jgi:hypothetical protein
MRCAVIAHRMFEAERLFRILLKFRRNVVLHARFNPHQVSEEDNMRKFGFAIAALLAIAVAAPSIASAETVVVKHRDHHWHHHHDHVVIHDHRG